MGFKVDVVNSQTMPSLPKMETALHQHCCEYACIKFQEILCSWNKIIPCSWSLLLFAYDLDERPYFLVQPHICFPGPIKFLCGTPNEV